MAKLGPFSVFIFLILLVANVGIPCMLPEHAVM